MLRIILKRVDVRIICLYLRVSERNILVYFPQLCYNMVMNFNTFSASTKAILSTKVASLGLMEVTKEAKLVGVISTGNDCKIIPQVIAGIMSQGCVATKFSMPEFGFLQRINPQSAKYAKSYEALVARNLEAFVTINMLDAVVIVSGCEVTTLGLLHACVKINCPVLVVPNIVNSTDAEDAGFSQKEIGFFSALEGLTLSLPGATKAKSTTGAQLDIAFRTGQEVTKSAREILTPKRFITKKTLQELAQSATNPSGLVMVATLGEPQGVKMGNGWITADKGGNIVRVAGNACEEGGYVMVRPNTPPSFSGRAWAYRGLEDADRAISSGQVTEGIIVVQACADQDISAIIFAIQKRGLTDKVAVITDGYAVSSPVLTVTHCTPSTEDNEAFANIQTGDILEIDLAKGRLNTSVLSKDMKGRQKRGAAFKVAVYF